jgi:hypothetical protein
MDTQTTEEGNLMGVAKRAKPKSKADNFAPVLAAKAVKAETPERPDRVGKRPLHVYLPADLHKALRQIALDEDVSLTELVLDSLTQLVARRR